ncbi:MAG: YesL family protein [Eubacteriales bacterium]|nr:YesL family protein [Eubacteriales bacterium]
MFNYDNAFWRFMGRVGDFTLLSILFLLCSIPLVTFGAALCAVYSVIFSILESRDQGMLRGYLKGLRQSFKHGIILSVLFIIIFGVIYIDIRLFPLMGLPQIVFYSLLGFTLFTFILALSIFIYVFPLEARYTNTLAALIKNAILLSIKNLPKTILMAVLDIVIIGSGLLSLVYVPQFFIFPLLLAVPAMAWVNSALLKKELKLEINIQESGNECI